MTEYTATRRSSLDPVARNAPPSAEAMPSARSRSWTFPIWTIAGSSPDRTRICANAMNVVGTSTPKYSASADAGTSDASSAACVWNGIAASLSANATHEDHDEQDERRGRLIPSEARRQRERGHAETAAERDEAEVAVRGLRAAIAMHLERERADGDEQSEQQRGVDRDRRREDQDREHGRGDRERGGKEVVRRLVHPHREHQERRACRAARPRRGVPAPTGAREDRAPRPRRPVGRTTTTRDRNGERGEGHRGDEREPLADA